MATRDPHRFVNQLDDGAVTRLVDRLESRAKDRVFARLLEQYLERLALSASGSVLEIGCGTGAVLRAIAARDEFRGTALGVDQGEAFVDAARRFAAQEGLIERIEFRVGDAHDLDVADDAFDTVIAHTLISHVTEPETVLREMARVVRSGGSVAIFDGDYASLTYGYPDHDTGRAMDSALANATFNNPLVMRDLSRLLPEFGFDIVHADGEAVTEIGSASFFRSFAETYAPLVKDADMLPAETVEAWLAAQRQAMEDGTFFASCNYYTFLARRR
jgi:ubiquinone/menaquinone biosynthesis C-methylase UbiE